MRTAYHGHAAPSAPISSRLIAREASVHQPARLSVAPMMDVTTKHFRYLLRLLSKRVQLWTEMITARAIIMNPNREQLLRYDPSEQPVVLQLGGNDPQELARAAAIAEQEFGYNEINLNCGCPSERVSGSGCFGAALMKDPARVREIVEAMRGAVRNARISVKYRVGVDSLDSYEYLLDFSRTLVRAGVQHLVVHARKAVVGLSPKANRRVPPLRHDLVRRLADDLRADQRAAANAQSDADADADADANAVQVTLNGGIETLEEAARLLREGRFAGVMIGRAVMNDPWLLARADHVIWGEQAPGPSRREVLQAFAEYCRREQLACPGTSARALLRQVPALLHTVPGARLWRQHLAGALARCTDAADLLLRSLVLLDPYLLDARYDPAIPLPLPPSLAPSLSPSACPLPEPSLSAAAS